MSPYVPALLAALAVLALAVPPAAAARVRALASGDPPRRGPSLLTAAAFVAGVTLGPLAAGAVVAAGAAARAVTRRAAAAKVAREHAAALPDLCRAVAAELRAGAPPAAALARAADDAPPALGAHLRRVAAAPPADWTGPPGADRLAAVGALWSVAADAGAGLADGLDRLAEALAAEERQRAEVAAQLAGPRASAAVLAGLPAFGLLLGAGLGAQPLRFLGTPPGLACLAVAVALDAAGVWWVRRLTARALA